MILAYQLLMLVLIDLAASFSRGELSGANTLDLNELIEPLESSDEATQGIRTRTSRTLDLISQIDWNGNLNENNIKNEQETSEFRDEKGTYPPNSDLKPELLRTQMTRYSMREDFNELINAFNHRRLAFKLGTISLQQSSFLEEIIETVKTLVRNRLAEILMPSYRESAIVIDGIDRDTSGEVFRNLENLILKDSRQLLEAGVNEIAFQPELFLVLNFVAYHELVDFDLLEDFMNDTLTLCTILEIRKKYNQNPDSSDWKALHEFRSQKPILRSIYDMYPLWKLISDENWQRAQNLKGLQV